MKRRIVQMGALALLSVPGIVYAQVDYSGTIPTTFAITNTSNGTLTGNLGAFSTLTIGSGTLVTPTVLAFRLRSNAAYKLSANSAVISGITNGVASAAGTTAQGIKTGDIGFGITAAIDQSGASVVDGGGTPTRLDPIVAGYSVIGGWPSVTDGHTPAFTKTLNSFFGVDTQILSGPRISASGDNSSSDNFLLVTVGLAALPQYLTPAAFSGTVTFTIAAP
ncbi:MAG TPA: hypothetical protein VM120_00995 [Bryobacteraceae bacterium]|nr:hypothetical protein [Bryobacteraceae bacterium]